MATSHAIGSLVEAFEKPRGQNVTVMGVVTEVSGPPRRMRTNEWMLSFRIQDQELAQLSTPYDGLKVRIFAKLEAELPQIESVGDVVLVRGARAVKYETAPILLHLKGVTSYVVFPKEAIESTVGKLEHITRNFGIKHLSTSASFVPSHEDYITAIMVKRELALHLNRKPPIGQEHKRKAHSPLERPAHRGSNFTMIKDATCGKFCDMQVEVVKIFPGQFEACELYVTDYTSNPALFNYPSPDEKEDELPYDGDAYGYMPVPKREWPGPYGSMVLKIEVKEPHATFVRHNINEGDSICLRNLRVKMSNQNKMEANLWPDYKYPHKILVHRAYDDELEQALKKRKEQYWSRFKRSTNLKTGDGTKTSKQKKKLKEKAKRAAAASSNDQQKPQQLPEPPRVINKHVRCMAKQDVQPSPLLDIVTANRSQKDILDTQLTRPFINQNRRAVVRVVDYYPSRLEDFSMLVNTSDAHDNDPIIVAYPTPQWEWAFTLLVEDAYSQDKSVDEPRTQVWLQVNHLDAEFLLDVNATNLRSDSQALAQLREKLAILWGNLEERKSTALQEGSPYPPKLTSSQEQVEAMFVDSALSNLPFECCIREYGAEVDQADVFPNSTEWAQIFAMFGTTIK